MNCPEGKPSLVYLNIYFVDSQLYSCNDRFVLKFTCNSFNNSSNKIFNGFFSCGNGHLLSTNNSV